MTFMAQPLILNYEVNEYGIIGCLSGLTMNVEKTESERILTAQCYFSGSTTKSQ